MAPFRVLKEQLIDEVIETEIKKKIGCESWKNCTLLLVMSSYLR